MSSRLTLKTNTRFSHLIPAALTGVAGAGAKFAFDFFAARPPAFNFCRVPTKDLVDLVHWGFVSSLTLRPDPSEKPTGQQTEEPIKVSKEEALLILDETYSLEGALELFREEPIKISQGDFSKLVEEEPSLQGTSTYFQIEPEPPKPSLVEGIDGKEKQDEDSLPEEPKVHQGESSSSESSPAEGLKGADEIANESEEKRLGKEQRLREELSSWISKINLEDAPPSANPTEKDSSSGMSLQEAILCWIGQANFFDQKDAFSKDAKTKANTVAYFVASAIASETLKQDHPILLNTASCLYLAAISAIAMPIISAVNLSIFSSAED
ncbi:MAG: hypothetical protein IT584_01375, partial [Chlamydiae bacterium]|nr:hypothetical protein [Chlamydiota bacterium]